MIRKFTMSDLDTILLIETDSFPKSSYGRSVFWYYAKLYPHNFLVYEYRDTGSDSHKLVGYIIFYPQGHIVSIAVHPAYRRRGIGTALVNEVLERTSGNAKVEVRRSNRVARAFYKNLGFFLRNIIPTYYGDEDAFVMERTGTDNHLDNAVQ